MNLLSIGQEKFSFLEVDKLTYQNYLEKKWDSIIETGNKAISQNIDYYYLRIRLGIAYYETQQYEKAIVNFEKSLEFNSNDALANEYIWYSYLFLGQYEEAQLFADGFSQELKNKLKISKSGFIKNIAFDSGYAFNSDFEDLKNSIIDNVDAIAYEKKIFKSQFHNSLLLNFNLSKRISLTTAYTNLNVNSYHWTKLSDTEIHDGIFNTRQHQLYAKLNLYNRKKSNLYVAFNYSPAVANEQVLIFDDSSLPPTVSVETRDTKMNSFAFVLGNRKTKRLISRNLFLSYSSINFFKQLQIGYSLLAYANSRKNTYFSTQVVLWNEPNPEKRQGKGGGIKPISRFMFEPSFGFKISSVWINGFATIGDVKNYVEADGLIINNNSDLISFRTGISLYVPITTKISFLAKTLMSVGESEYIFTKTPASMSETPFSYTFYYGIGSIQYKF
ncbi:MAG TPA: hypothetical protein DDX39_04460 [Bacteroidales bacterium]|nr:MAG: hypothetical protein A2W98_10540 [Bacteroidetes bacterium GWF2_33_38]OFY86663.1 MAG: hypothetical protein A2236_13200 [Bacteroidetes bacterium RIFOXYA2_FULL_33_7]HBF87876.1 hypothetical protein [Bacteroidales bacterium]